MLIFKMKVRKIMGLLSKEIEICVGANRIMYYEKLGYDIPKKINKRNQLVYDIGNKIIVNTEDLPPNSTVYVEVECDNCKKQYKKLYHDYQKSKKLHDEKIYCVNCIQKVFKKKMEYEERDRRKFYADYTTFIAKVLKRDNYICQCCGKKDDNLEVHHLDGYDWCKEKRIDVTNGITLCKQCHFNFHGKYGRGNNTKEQFQEWLGDISVELEVFDNIITSTRKIYCYEEDKIYDSAEHFASEHNLNSTGAIYKVCNNKELYNTSNGKHLFWYDEYIKLTTEEIERIVNKPSKKNIKKVICLTTNVIYDSITEGARKENASKTSVNRCCNKQYSHVHTKDGRITQWMFYDDFLKLKENEEL
jgi:hypothetical protein